MRHVTRVLMALMLCLGTFVLIASGSATARPLSTAAAGCSGAVGYPFSPSATIEVSGSAPSVGSTVEVSGSHYCPDEDITITIGGTVVGTGHTDASGSFDPAVTVPSRTGEVQLCGSGETPLAANSDCLTLSVQAAAQVGGQNNGGGTASTGVRVALILAVALLLIAGGVAFATAGRSRKSAAISG